MGGFRFNLDLGRTLEGVAGLAGYGFGGIDSYQNPAFDPNDPNSQPYINPSFWSRWLNKDTASKAEAANEQWRMAMPTAQRTNIIQNAIATGNIAKIAPLISGAYPQGTTPEQMALLQGGSTLGTSAATQGGAVRGIQGGLPQAEVDSSLIANRNAQLQGLIDTGRLQQGLFGGLGPLRGQGDLASAQENLNNSNLFNNIKYPYLQKYLPLQGSNDLYKAQTERDTLPYQRIIATGEGRNAAMNLPTRLATDNLTSQAGLANAGVNNTIAQTRAQMLPLIAQGTRQGVAADAVRSSMIPEGSIRQAIIDPNGNVGSRYIPQSLEEKMSAMTSGAGVVPPGQSPTGTTIKLPQRPLIQVANPTANSQVGQTPITPTIAQIPANVPAADGSVSIGGMQLGKQPMAAKPVDPSVTAQRAIVGVLSPTFSELGDSHMYGTFGKFSTDKIRNNMAQYTRAFSAVDKKKLLDMLDEYDKSFGKR